MVDGCEVIAHSASLADRVALRTSAHGIDEIADEIAAVIAEPELRAFITRSAPDPPGRSVRFSCVRCRT